MRVCVLSNFETTCTLVYCCVCEYVEVARGQSFGQNINRSAAKNGFILFLCLLVDTCELEQCTNNYNNTTSYYCLYSSTTSQRTYTCGSSRLKKKEPVAQGPARPSLSLQFTRGSSEKTSVPLWKNLRPTPTDIVGRSIDLFLVD